MKSMTGYGSSQANLKGLSLEVSVRSVNGRYLDVRTHLPKDFVSFEAPIKELVKKNFRRGTVDIFVQPPAQAAGEAAMGDLDLDVAQVWIQKINELKKKTKVGGDVDISTLLTLPGVVKTSKSIILSASDRAVLLKSCEKAMEDCEQFRQKEGKNLAAVLKSHLQEIALHLKQIDSLQSKYEAQLMKKLKEEIATAQSEELRVQTEMKANESLEKANIQEEISRLKQHLDAAESLLRTKESMGKKLDFFAQEFLREMNTIGSKCQSAEITSLVIKGKSGIESFREQVQNVE